MKNQCLWLMLTISVCSLIGFGCTSMVGFKGAASEGLGQFTLDPGYYTVWTEIPRGDGNIVFWFGKADPRGGYITIDKIFMSKTPSADDAALVLDFTANPFQAGEPDFWWANFENYVTGGRYSCGTSSGDRWGGGFNYKGFRDYSYIGFSILLDKNTVSRMGDALAEINGTQVKFADLVRPLLGEK